MTLLLICIAGMLSGAPETYTDVMVDFPANYAADAAYKQSSVKSARAESSVEMKNSGDRSLKLTFMHEAQGYSEFVLKPFTDNARIEMKDGVLRTAAYAAAGGMMIKLRLTDAKGETFQTKPLNMKQGEWTVREWKISEEMSSDLENSWGGNNNKRMEFPVSFFTLILEGKGDGTAYLDRMTYTYTEKETAAVGEVAVVKMDREPMQLKPVAASKAKETEAEFLTDTVSGRKSLRLSASFDPSGWAEYLMRGFTDGFTITERGGVVTLRGRNITPKAVVSLRFIDKNGETFQTDGFSLTGGTSMSRMFKIDESAKSDIRDSWGAGKDGVFDFPLTFSAVVISGSGDTSAVIDSIIYAGPAQAEYLASVSRMGTFAAPVANKRIFLWEKGESFRMAPVFVSKSRRDMTAAIEMKITDFNGIVVTSKSKNITLAPRESKELPIPFSTADAASGIYYVNLRALTTNGLTISETNTSFGIIDGKNTARAKPGEFIYAMCAHAERFPSNEVFQLDHPYWQWLDSLGIDMVRGEAAWGRVQPKPGDFIWHHTDKMLSNHLAIRVQSAPILAYFVHWASDYSNLSIGEWWNKHRAEPPRDMTPFYNYVDNTVRRYKDTMRYWEVWNEADWGFWMGTPEQYNEMYLETYKRIKAIDPTLQVMNSGWAFGLENQHKSLDRIDSFLAAAKDKLDIFAFHAHSGIGELKQKDAKIRAFFKKYGIENMKVWDNESGWSTIGKRTEQDQAEQLVKKIVYAQVAGYGAYFWYDLFNDGPDRNENEHNFGIIRESLSEPKAGVLAYHALIRSLRGYKYKETLALGEKISAYLFIDGAEEVCVLWLDDNAEKYIYLSPGKTADAKHIDMMGNTKPLTAIGERLGVKISYLPSYVRWKRSGAASSISAVTTVLSTDPLIRIQAGVQNPFSVSVRNPLDKTLAGKMSVTTRGFSGTVTPKDTALSLPNGGNGKWDFSITADKNGSDSDAVIIRLSDGSTFIGDMTVPVKYVTIVPQVTATIDGTVSEWTSPVAVLSERKDIFNLFDFDPTKPDLHWKGPNDLSATAYVGADSTRFYCAVVVKDDTHFQRENANELWKADCLQFGISPDGNATFTEYDIGLSDGKVLTIKRSGSAPAALLDGELTASVRRDEGAKTTTYEIAVLRSVIGRDDFGFNFIVNDNEGKARKGWVKWKDGIGDGKKPALWPWLKIK
ncbi:MAG: hypothetical protein HZC28_15805 [Spirochaetes bacterium]|nr:hypothetical protein [Spirochaetota bacterium]